MRKKVIFFSLMLVALICGASQCKAQYNKEYFYWMGRNSMMNSDYREAIRTLNILLRFDEDAHEGYFLRGIAKYNLNDLVGADADFTIAIEKNPVFTNAFTYRAITRSRLGNYDDALKDFEEAISLRPDIPNAYYSRGVTRLLNQQFQLAIDDFDMFIKQEGKVVDAYINRGLSYLHLKDTISAYNNFNTAIRTNRENPDGYNRRGTLYMQQDKLKDAESDFNMAIKYDTAHLASYFNRALVYNRTNRPTLSLKDFDQVIEIDSTNSLTYFNRAIVRSQIGDYNRALEDYNMVATYSPNNVLVYYNRAQLLARLGDMQAAEQNYSKAIELYPDFANAYLGRSGVRQLLNNPQGARSDKNTAEKKLANYRSRLSDSTYSIYSDTTYQFDRLLSFDTKFSNSATTAGSTEAGADNELALLPLFKFSFERADTTIQHESYSLRRVEDFKAQVNNSYLELSNTPTNLTPDSLLLLEEEFAAELKAKDDDWITLFEMGIAESLIKQYTNAVNTFTSAIALNPTNPFLYLNRSTTRAEMIDFISSIDNSYQRITIDSDPANRLKSSGIQTYSYDEAIADLNKSIKLFPELAHTYYNRGNLLARSGKLPEAFEDFSRAIELNPHFAEAYYNRGVVQILLKDTNKGVLDISKAGELGIDRAYTILKNYTNRQ